MLKCKKCGKEKSEDEYYLEKRSKRGYQARCKECCKADARAVFEANPEPYRERAKAAHSYEKRRARTLAKHGLTENDYQELLDKQKGHCAICPSTISNHNMTDLLLVDHCHETGKVRGLLCHNCNALLGHAKDNHHRLIAATFYIHKHKNA